jgi:hypothetical protein
MATKMITTRASQCVGVLFVILAVAVSRPERASAADLVLRIKPPATRETPTSSERQKRLFEEFMLWLRSRPLP